MAKALQSWILKNPQRSPFKVGGEHRSNFLALPPSKVGKTDQVSEAKQSYGQSSQEVPMNNESKENKCAVVRGRAKNARTSWQSLKPLTATNKITDNQQDQQTKTKGDSDSDSSMSRDEAEFQSLMQESQNKVVMKPKSEKEMKKKASRDAWFDPKKFDTKWVKHPAIVKKLVPKDDKIFVVSVILCLMM